jgi:hypothetical protein
MEPEGSIPNSQELSTCSYPEPDQFSPHIETTTNAYSTTSSQYILNFFTQTTKNKTARGPSAQATYTITISTVTYKDQKFEILQFTQKTQVRPLPPTMHIHINTYVPTGDKKFRETYFYMTRPTAMGPLHHAV